MQICHRTRPHQRPAVWGCALHARTARPPLNWPPINRPAVGIGRSGVAVEPPGKRWTLTFRQPRGLRCNPSACSCKTVCSSGHRPRHRVVRFTMYECPRCTCASLAMLDCEPTYAQSCQKTCCSPVHGTYFERDVFCATMRWRLPVRLPLHARELGRETEKPSGLPSRSTTSKTAQYPIASTTSSGIARCDSSRGTARRTS